MLKKILLWFRSTLTDILRGAVIGLANVVPGVSGGTMMMSMGIFDKIIYCINHVFREFRKCFRILLPYIVGMALAIILGAVALNIAFERFPLPTNALFVGLILGSLPLILAQMKGLKITPVCVILFLLCAAAVIVPKVIALRTLTEGNANGGNTALSLDAGGIAVLFLLGILASASMVIPGISGSMILKILGYYNPIVTDTIGGTFKTALPARDWALVGHNLLILVPFALGILVGIFGVARLIEMLLKNFRIQTYSAILGLVAASPVVILMDPSLYAGGVSAGVITAGVVALFLGALAAWKLGGDRDPAPRAS